MQSSNRAQEILRAKKEVEQGSSNTSREGTGSAEPERFRRGNRQDGKIPADFEEWEYLSSELFPQSDFPWEILPAGLAQSLRQLAESCATSPTSLPGCVFAITGSILGRNLSTSPKDRWEEPSIVWCSDIRPTGAGKTPAANALMRPIHEVQAEAHRKRVAELDHWKGLPRKDRENTPEPPKERGWFISDLTLEGLRDDLEGHPTGGLMILQEELSAFVNSQNQYRNGKGSDREAWLQLWDGHDARIKRAGRETFLRGARVNIFGGIQPAIFRRVFSSESGLYLLDGTIFRFLFTHERDQHFPLDCISWAETHSREWARFIQNAIWWGEKREKPHRAILNSTAQKQFFSWRNEIFSQKDLMPDIFRGFIPKATSYALRLAGIIHFLHRMAADKKEPDSILSIEDIHRGIAAARFYLGQAADAMKLIHDEGHKPGGPMDPRVRALAETLEALKLHLDNGRLSVSFLRDEFNKRAAPHQRFSEKPQSKAFGLFLRKCGLTVSESLLDYKDQRRVKCLLYDEHLLHLLHLLQDEAECGFPNGEHQKASSPCSPSEASNKPELEKMENMGEHLLHPQSLTNKGFREDGEDGEDVSIEDSKISDGTLREYLNGLCIGREGEPKARRFCLSRGYLDQSGRLTQAGEDFLWSRAPGSVS